MISPARGPSTVGLKPITSVGIGTSSVPYGAFGTFAASNTGRWGYIGPSADALQLPTTWYVRATGSNNNGGTSTAAGGDRSGSDGVTNGTTLFTSATAAFTSADIGKGICINTGANARHHRIVAVASGTNITLDRTSSNASGLAWVIGGAWADHRVPLGDVNVNADTNSAVRAGDTVYIGAGTYRQVTSTGITPAFNGIVNIIGDVDGSKTGDAGMVQLTGYTTNDKTAPSGTALLNLNGKSNLAFSNVMFMSGSISAVTAATATSQNITFRKCSVLAGGTTGAYAPFNQVTTAFGKPSNWMIDSCLLVNGNATSVDIRLTQGSGSDYSSAISVINCLFLAGSNAVGGSGTGAGVNLGGGVFVTGCTFWNPFRAVNTTAAQVSLTFPYQIQGSFIYMGSNNAALNAGTSGQIIESYNLIVGATPRTNVAVGTGSISDGSYAPLFHFGQETQWGGLLRRFGEPMASSPLLGFGSSDPIASNPLDLRGFPRPAGLNSPLPAVGAFERANTAIQATSPAPPSGTNVWQFTGPGYQDFSLPVDTSSTTVACTVQRDTNYAGTLPSISVLANPTIGVPAQTVFDTGGTASNNAIALAPFTTTAIGAVTIRVRSQDLSGTSVVAFSVFTVT